MAASLSGTTLPSLMRHTLICSSRVAGGQGDSKGTTPSGEACAIKIDTVAVGEGSRDDLAINQHFEIDRDSRIGMVEHPSFEHTAFDPLDMPHQIAVIGCGVACPGRDRRRYWRIASSW